MAPKRKKQYQGGGSSANPNTALVIFLVIACILVLGLGFFGYQAYQEKDKAEKRAAELTNTNKLTDQAAQWAQFISQEARMAVGGPTALTSGEVDEAVNWQDIRASLMDPASPRFKDAKNLEKIREFAKLNEKLLGYNTAKKAFNTTYLDVIKKQQKELEQLRADYQAAVDAKTQAENALAAYKTKFDPEFANLPQQLKEIEKKAIEEAQKKYDQLVHFMDQNEQLKAKLAAQQQEHEKEKLESLRIIEELEKKIAKRGGGPGPGVILPTGQQQEHALFLDISTGKTMWDRPKGKIIRVDTPQRKVYINIGRADGVTPLLTFNVFAAGPEGTGIGRLKGTIEVIDVIDDNTSVARITSAYDSAGQPIALYDPRKGGVIRAADNPIQEGDLIYNMFWKTHIAVVGKINATSYDPRGVGEENRRLKEVIDLLRRQGIIVDAYLDLADGTVKGELTPETQFLVVGEKAVEDLRKQAADDPSNVAAKQLNAKIEEVKKLAIERGIFIISADNFLHLIGYREPSSAISARVSEFTPQLPTFAAPKTEAPDRGAKVIGSK